VRKLSNKVYFEYLFLEVNNFDILFIDYLLGNTEQNLFYINQLQNITLNYKIFTPNNFNETNLINLFSFQIALIIEYMTLKKIDTKLFNQALQTNSIKPFLDKCKEIEKVKSFKDLAVEFSNIHVSLQEKTPDIIIEDIHPDTFQKELSLWNKGRNLPSLIKMFVIVNSAAKNETKEQKIGMFVQLLIIRGLLHIQKEFNLDEDVKVKCLEQLENFRAQIRECYLQNEEDKLFKQQAMYLIDFSTIFEFDDPEKIYQQLKPKIDAFAKYNDEKITTGKLMLPDRELLIEEFSQCKSKEEYMRLFDKLNYSLENEPFYPYVNNTYNVIKFIISIKIEDKKLFKEQLKSLDRSLGGLLSLYNIDHNLTKYMTLLENKFDLLECIECIADDFKNCQQ